MAAQKVAVAAVVGMAFALVVAWRSSRAPEPAPVTKQTGRFVTPAPAAASEEDRLELRAQRFLDLKRNRTDAASIRVANEDWRELRERVVADPSLFLALLGAESDPERIEGLLTLLDESWILRPNGYSRVGTSYSALPEEIRRALKDALAAAPSGTKLAILRHFGTAVPAAIVRDNLDLLLADPEWEISRRALEVVADDVDAADLLRQKIDALLQRGPSEERKQELLDLLTRRLWRERVGGSVSHPDLYVTVISSALNATTSPETFTACLKAAIELPAGQTQRILTMAESRCPTPKLKNAVSRMLARLRNGETLQRLIE